jgi:hypothetical protein
LAAAFITLGPRAVPWILETALFVSTAPFFLPITVPPTLHSPFSIAIKLTIGSISPFVPETLFATKISLVTEAFPSFRALLRPRSLATPPLIVEALLPIRAPFSTFLSTAAPLVIGVFLPFRTFAASTALFSGAILRFGPLVCSALRRVSARHIPAASLLVCGSAGSSRGSGLSLGGFAPPTMLGRLR